MSESLKGKSIDDVAAPSASAATLTKKDEGSSKIIGEETASTTAITGESSSGGPGNGSVTNDPSSLPPSIIDMEIFGQLLEMDDEDDREFSKEIVWNYFDQAETTFEKMDTAFKDKNLVELSTLGHFLKGSSAAVGVIKVRDSCEYMQHYGKKADKDGITQLNEEEALKKIEFTLNEVKVEYKEAEKALRQIYSDSE